MHKRIILITGAAGLIGRELCHRLLPDNEIIGVDSAAKSVEAPNFAWEQVDLTDLDSVAAVCLKYVPDVVIHCAGIAHQKIGAITAETYMTVNSKATEDLAKAVIKINPEACFIFFSSVSVYGENNLNVPISEENIFFPTSDYAVSKLDAERRLIALYNKKTLRNLVILRLAPVYDRKWHLNLGRRVFSPKKLAFLRFGSGMQRISALALPNIIEFVKFLINGKYSLCDQQSFQIFNICDARPYEFEKIIKVFKRINIYSHKLVIPVPLSLVWLGTRIAGILFPTKKIWMHSCYNKLAFDLVYSNRKMLETGFKPTDNIESIFSING